MTIEPGLYLIKNGASWTVLDESTDGQHIVHGWQQANVANQRWRVTEAGNGVYFIQNEESGLFLHAAEASDGTRLVSSNDATPWHLYQDEEHGWVYITHPDHAHVVDLHEGQAEDGTPINLWGRNDGAVQQRWFFEKLD
ncbi:ricin B lectin domain-containing protein [Rhizoctonia solani]|nr:ricin B lectin domain-containing protein [Rhizoctonia solani]